MSATTGMVETGVRRRPVLSGLQSAVGWSCLIVVLISALPFGSNDPVYWVGFTVLVFAIFFLQMVLGLFRGVSRHSAMLFGPALLYIGVLAWGLAQVSPSLPPEWAHPVWSKIDGAVPLVSADPIQGFHVVLKLGTYGMVFWIAAQSGINRERAFTLLSAFALFAAVLSLFGLYAVFSGNNFILGPTDGNVVRASFINRNSFATYAAFGLIVNVGLYAHAVRRQSEMEESHSRALRRFIEQFFGGGWIFAFSALLCLAALLLTQSRAGFAAGTTGLFFLLLLLRRGSSSWIYLWISVLIVFGLSAATLSEALLSRFGTASADARFIVYPEVWKGILDRPLLGHGLGSFYDTFSAYVPLEAAIAEWTLAHSSYLENAYELGLPAAAALYTGLVWVFAVLVVGAVRRKESKVLCAVAAACVFAGGLHAVVDFSLQMPAIAAALSFVAGLGWSQSFRNGPGRPEPLVLENEIKTPSAS